MCTNKFNTQNCTYCNYRTENYNHIYNMISKNSTLIPATGMMPLLGIPTI